MERSVSLTCSGAEKRASVQDDAEKTGDREGRRFDCINETRSFYCINQWLL
jgi:hypothetical protein